jgi:hypothetical protein
MILIEEPLPHLVVALCVLGIVHELKIHTFTSTQVSNCNIVGLSFKVKWRTDLIFVFT